MHALQRWRRTFGRARAWLPLLLEIAVTLASISMAWMLLRDQTYFDRYPASYGWFVTHFPSQEWIYGMIAGAAAALKMAGMLCLLPRQSERFMDTAFILREIGWGMSVVFWAGLALILNHWDTSSLGAITSRTIALFALGGMLMGPAMPEEDLIDGRYGG